MCKTHTAMAAIKPMLRNVNLKLLTLLVPGFAVVVLGVVFVVVGVEAVVWPVYCVVLPVNPGVVLVKFVVAPEAVLSGVSVVPFCGMSRFCSAA